jgi:hypothetical protein
VRCGVGVCSRAGTIWLVSDRLLLCEQLQVIVFVSIPDSLFRIIVGAPFLVAAFTMRHRPTKVAEENYVMLVLTRHDDRQSVKCAGNFVDLHFRGGRFEFGPGPRLSSFFFKFFLRSFNKMPL